MTDKELVLNTLRKYGAEQAQALQEKAGELTGTALYDEKDFIPPFAAARAKKNMLERPAGFVCRSTAGRVVSLLQLYDSDTYPQEPEELPAQWRFKWSTDPEKALPFMKLATSPYGEGDCCIWGEQVMRSKIANNVYSPEEYPAGWEAVE